MIARASAACSPRLEEHQSISKRRRRARLGETARVHAAALNPKVRRSYDATDVSAFVPPLGHRLKLNCTHPQQGVRQGSRRHSGSSLPARTGMLTQARPNDHST